MEEFSGWSSLLDKNMNQERASSTETDTGSWFDDFCDNPVSTSLESDKPELESSSSHLVKLSHRRAVSDTLALVDATENASQNARTEIDPVNEEDLASLDPSLDPKRARRIIANRQSAQRSRIRKLQYIAELEKSVNSLQMEVSALSPQVSFLDHQRVLLNVDNHQRIAALVQNVRMKDAHNEALSKELERLRHLYQQQQQFEIQQQY